MNISTLDFVRLVLHEASRYYFLDAAQIRSLIDDLLTERAVAARCDRMIKNGLLLKLDSGVRTCWTPTKLGLDLIRQSHAPIKHIAPYLARHTTTVADVGVALTREGHAVRTERELWAAQTANRDHRGKQWNRHTQQTELLLPNGTPINPQDYHDHVAAWLAAWNRPHMPDLECWLAGERIAIEVELTQKTHARVREVMTYYGSDRSPYRTIAYFCATPSIRRQVERLSAECAPTVGLLTYLPASDLYAQTLPTWDEAA